MSKTKDNNKDRKTSADPVGSDTKEHEHDPQAQAAENTEKVDCEDLAEAVPASEDDVKEAEEYVVHKGGVDCHQKWEQKKKGKGDKS